MKLKNIYLYPVKSLRGVSATECKVDHLGIENDRRWMLVDSQNNFITQRQYPELCHFSVNLHEDIISLSHPATTEQQTLPVVFNCEDFLAVRIWGEEVNALSHAGASNWFSSILKIAVKVVYIPPENRRPLIAPEVTDTRFTSFVDRFPILVIGNQSLEKLNKRLASPITMDRFRPNIVVETTEAHEEDHWRSFKIGSVEFRGIRECYRCSVITINPLTGQKSDEPLKTLAKYRLKEGKINFGLNATNENTGFFKFEDDVKIETLRNAGSKTE